MFLAERSRLLIVAALLVAGAAVRLVNLDQSVLSFHPTRQFRSAIIARACYYERTPAIPDWARRVAVANRGIQPAAELTIMEGLACAAYQMAGRESHAFPRIFASI